MSPQEIYTGAPAKVVLDILTNASRKGFPRTPLSSSNPDTGPQQTPEETKIPNLTETLDEISALVADDNIPLEYRLDLLDGVLATLLGDHETAAAIDQRLDDEFEEQLAAMIGFM